MREAKAQQTEVLRSWERCENSPRDEAVARFVDTLLNEAKEKPRAQKESSRVSETGDPANVMRDEDQSDEEDNPNMQQAQSEDSSNTRTKENIDPQTGQTHGEMGSGGG